MRRALPLALVVGLLAAAPAQAFEPEPASHVGPDAMLRDALTVADKRWAAMGRPLPCAPELLLYVDDDYSVAARADMPGCRVYVSVMWRNSVYATLVARSTPRGYRRALLAEVCAIMTHERGHNLGLGHIEGTIMATPVLLVPGRCARWARRITRRPLTF